MSHNYFLSFVDTKIRSQLGLPHAQASLMHVNSSRSKESYEIKDPAWAVL